MRELVDTFASYPFTTFHGAERRKVFHLPLPVEAGEAGPAGEEPLHGGLLEVAFLGDESCQPLQERIHIAQRRRDGALFGESWKCSLNPLDRT